MADNKKYYYLKLKDNFFDSDELIVLESMPDGYLYSNILLKLYLRSLKNEGKLMLNERIPYNPTILSQVTRHNVGVVEKALDLFTNLGLIEKLDNGAIYMTDIQNFIGTSSTEADRKRSYRHRIENDKVPLIGQMSDKCPDKTTLEIEIEKELEIEIEIKKEKKPTQKQVFSNMITEYTSNPSLTESIESFIDMRKSIKAKLTTNALKLMLSKLSKLANNDSDKIEILDQSTMNSYKGIFALKNNNQSNANSFNEDFKESMENGAIAEAERLLRERGKI